MFALLQINPPEALDGADCGVDVLVVDDSEERLEQFAAEYEERYRAAHQERNLWDNISSEWDETHDRKIEELEQKYCV
jgi:hypothetical protein